MLVKKEILPLYAHANNILNAINKIQPNNTHKYCSIVDSNSISKYHFLCANMKSWNVTILFSLN